MSIFLATYRAFATLQDILEILLKRYEEWVNTERSNGLGDGTTRGKDMFRKAVTSIFVVWFDQYPEDFLSDLSSLHLLLPFFAKISPGSEAERRAHSLLNSNAQLHLTQEVERGVSSSGVVFSLGEEDDVEVIAEDEKVEILTFSAESVAEQLTFMDSELFRRVIPHQCLGSVWSRRDQRGNSHLAPSVRATITQFNAVTSAVQETVLRPGDHSSGPRTSALLRARIIEQWIDIAQECRILKNFSSLRAILSTLQSNAIHRLKKSWGFVSREKILIFDELSEIFSDENNYFMSREILMKEGTSKFANMESCIKGSQKRSIKRLQSQKELGLMQGTVPYLGTFLTDLTMLDTALPDFVYGGLINFEKRRKEFEIIAQIRLLQSACNNYSLNPAPRFLAWFHRQEPLSESEGYALSCAAEPLVDSTPNTPGNKKSMVKRLSLLFAVSEIPTMSPPAKTPSSEMEMLPCSPCSPADGALLLMRGTQGSMSGDLTDSMSMASSCSEPDEGTVGLPDLPQALHEMPPDDSSLTSLHSNDLTFGASAAFTPPSSSSSSMSSPRSSFNLPSNRIHQRSVSCSAVPRPVYNQQTDDSCIIRVSLETGSDGNLYRSLLLTSQDKTAVVIQKAMEKHNLSQEPVENFQLVQTISNERELVMPDKANVFYAMSTSANFDFVLRRKSAINSSVAGVLSSQSSSSLPNMKSKALSLSKTTF
uniref:Ral guanine nucleotide dissociation stimulator-like 1 n=1 Tax=Eptatretus burgeri TaxID=7764 RepID=A0A8C4R934_EPTBU